MSDLSKVVEVTLLTSITTEVSVQSLTSKAISIDENSLVNMVRGWLYSTLKSPVMEWDYKILSVILEEKKDGSA